MIGKTEIEGFEALTLGAERAGIEVAFAPGAGMVGCSLRHRGEQLLGRRGGLRAYVAERSTMGIPLLHPWANRLGRSRFALAGREVDLDLASPPPSTDPAGRPIHGLLAAAPGWRVVGHEPGGDGGRLVAEFDFAAAERLLAAFPFPHALRFEAVLDGPTLTIETTVRASGGTVVPVAFGYHPYLRLPRLERSRWRVELPVGERLVLDEAMLPTGAREPAAIASGALGSRTYDDEFAAPPGSAPLALVGGGRRIEVRLGSGYPFTHVYAPADDDVVALEPMTAPTNSLLSGSGLTLLPPGEDYRASFSISVLEAGP